MGYKDERPIFRISKSVVYEGLEKLYEVVDEVSYSWKTNPVVGEILNNDKACYVSVHSLNELQQVPEKEKVWYFLFSAEEEELKTLFDEYGVKNFVIETEEDLENLLAFAENRDHNINVLLRMRLKENTLFTGKHYVFGMGVDKIKALIDKLYNDTSVEELGVHFHRKTQNVSEWSLKSEVIESLGDEYLEKIDLINIGGGLPSKYKNVRDRTIESVFSKIKEFTDYANSKGVKVIAEPGRFIASPAGKLETRVIAVHDNTVFLNASIFSGALDTVVANVKLLVEGEVEDKGKKYLLKGCTPDSCDILRYSVNFQTPPQRGDKIVFLNAGAYNYTTDFCALSKPKIEIDE